MPPSFPSGQVMNLRDLNEYLCGARTPDGAWALNSALQSFDDWLAENGKRIPLD
jgi:hypothetical protein